MQLHPCKYNTQLVGKMLLVPPKVSFLTVNIQLLVSQYGEQRKENAFFNLINLYFCCLIP